MIIVETHPSTDMKLSAQVATSTVLLQIQPRQVRMDSKIRATFKDPAPAYMATFKQDNGKFELRESENLIDVHVGIDIRLFAVDKEHSDREVLQDNWSVWIELLFVLTYGLPPGQIPDEIKNAGFAAFSKLNARLACWPYIRHQANHLASELGIPFVMPTLVLQASREAKPDSPSNP